MEVNNSYYVIHYAVEPGSDAVDILKSISMGDGFPPKTATFLWAHAEIIIPRVGEFVEIPDVHDETTGIYRITAVSYCQGRDWADAKRIRNVIVLMEKVACMSGISRYCDQD